MGLKLYVTSSFANKWHNEAVTQLRASGHEVFDYREGPHASALEDYEDPEDRAVFDKDKAAIDECDALVLILPGGRGAHLEAGYASGLGKHVFIWDPPEAETKPELMYGLCTATHKLLHGLIADVAMLRMLKNLQGMKR